MCFKKGLTLLLDRGPLLQTLFASFILMHKKTDVTSAMLSKDLFSRLTETTTKLCHVTAARLSYWPLITIYIYSVRLTRKLRYSAQPVTGALSKQLNYLVALTYVSVSRIRPYNKIT